MAAHSIGIPQPFWIGQRLVVLPAGADSACGAGRIPVWIRPGGAFGTGGHPTTGLCLRALERHLPWAAKVIDVGTGTGILAVAAIKLGASSVLAVDIEPEAVEAAVGNARANGVERQIRIMAGSVGTALEEVDKSGPAAFVMVNILAGVMEQLFSEGLDSLVQSGGVLVLSGILPAQTPVIRACLGNAGFTLMAQEHEGEWICMLAKRV